MELAEAIKGRRSVRRFKPDPISRNVIEGLLDTAIWAPSAMNRQEWSFVVVQGEKVEEMKKIFADAYQDMKPIIVYGGTVKEFFGEYMAGGILVALGLKIENGNPHTKVSNANPKEIVRGSLGTGIHGGAIYIRGKVPESVLGVGATILSLDTEDEKLLKPILKEFCYKFKVPVDKIWEKELLKIIPASARPYGSYYNYRSV